MSIQRYFETLGLDQKVTVQKAKESYINLVRIWHPDQFSNDTVFKARAEEKLKEINAAYSEVISFLSLQEKPFPWFNCGVQKLYLTLSACGDIGWRMGTNFFEMLRKLYVHAFSDDAPQDEMAGSNAFTESNRPAMRWSALIVGSCGSRAVRSARAAT